VSGGLFAGAGLLQRLRSVPVTVADLRRAADEVLPAMATGRLRISLVDDRVDGPVVVLEEDERRVRTPLRDLAEDMTDARVGSAPEELAAALAVWVDDRPVPDAVAAEAGVAVLDWTDRTETAVGWSSAVAPVRCRGRRRPVWTGAPSSACAQRQGSGPPTSGAPCGWRVRWRCGRTRRCRCSPPPCWWPPSCCWTGSPRPGSTWRTPTSS
jgi:hypothetical protein